MVIKMYNHTGINRKGPRIEPCGTPFDNGEVVFLFRRLCCVDSGSKRNFTSMFRLIISLSSLPPPNV